MFNGITQGYPNGGIVIQGYYAGEEVAQPYIVAESGSGDNAAANSYVTVEQARAYAKARGKAKLFEDFDKTEQSLVVAKDYLDSLSYKGLPTFVGQPLAWPRAGVYINWLELDDDAIPQAIANAQIEIAIAVASGIDIFPNSSGTESFVKRKKVGPIEKEFEKGASFGSVVLSAALAMLGPYLTTAGGLRVVRV